MYRKYNYQANQAKKWNWKHQTHLSTQANSRSLGPNGSRQALWKAWCIVGAIGWENLIQTYGIFFLAVWCGLFGRKEIGALLRIPRNPWFNYKLYARRPYLIGLGVGASRIVPLSWSLFLLLVLHFKLFRVVWCCLFFCCISLCSPSWTPCICFLLFYNLFNNTIITYQKRNSRRKKASARDLIFLFLERSKYSSPTKCSKLSNEGSYSKSPHFYAY